MSISIKGIMKEYNLGLIDSIKFKYKIMKAARQVAKSFISEMSEEIMEDLQDEARKVMRDELHRK